MSHSVVLTDISDNRVSVFHGHCMSDAPDTPAVVKFALAMIFMLVRIMFIAMMLL